MDNLPSPQPDPLKKLKPRQRAWLEHYLDGKNATEAARLAGYEAPNTDGPRLKRNLKQVIEQVILTREAAKIVQAREVMVLLSELARDKKHKDQLQAIKLLAEIHGLLDKRITIIEDRVNLVRELEKVLRNLAPVLDISPTSPMALSGSTAEEPLRNEEP